jgi:hypothetical protein
MRETFPYPDERPESAHLLLCGCGPGELVGWADPLMEAARRAGKPWRFSLLIWPRWLASPRVAEVARAGDRFSSVLDAGSALRLVAGGRLPAAWGGQPPSLLLHLGGAPALSLRLGARWRRPVVAYSERPLTWNRGFARVFCATRESCAAANAPADGGRHIIVGDLLVDAVADLRTARGGLLGSPAAGLTLGFFPGSRTLQLRHYLPRIPAVAAAVGCRVPSVRFLIARSPFVTDTQLARALEPEAPGSGAVRIIATAEGSALQWAEDQPPMPILAREQALARADLMVCTPGTTTAEAAALGIPMLVVAPFAADFRLFAGLPGVLERVPRLGPTLRQFLLKRMADGMGYYAYPNVRAQRELVPELQGPVDVVRIAETLVNLLENGAARNLMAGQLIELMGSAGAAGRLVAELDACLP